MTDFKKIIADCPDLVKNSRKETAPLFRVQGTYAARIYQIYDADSCYFTILLNNQPVSFKARILHIDSAEIKSKDPICKELAYMARDRVRELLDGQIAVIECSPEETDKYGRILINIKMKDGQDLAELLLREKLAFPYDGGTKRTVEEFHALMNQRKCLSEDLIKHK